MESTSPKVSVVILNWNGAAMLRRFLPSVVAHSPEARVVVADNGSTDDSVLLLKENFPTVECILLDRNYGFAEGYNRALAQVSTPYSLLLNSDVEVPQGWLAPLLSFMEAHPEAAACQPKLLQESQRDWFEYAGAAGGYIDRLGYPYCRGRLMATVEKDRAQYDTPAPVFWATGAALMIRTALYHEVGGLDGRFFAHNEEIDLCWRLRARGHAVWCVPESKVYHVGGGTLSKSNPRKTFLNFRNNLLMLYKNLPEAELRPVLRWRFWLDRLAALQMLLTGHWADARAVMRARREFRRMLPGFAQDRAVNQALAVTENIPERTPRSLLWQYYVKRRRRFSQWP